MNATPHDLHIGPRGREYGSGERPLGFALFVVPTEPGRHRKAAQLLDLQMTRPADASLDVRCYQRSRWFRALDQLGWSALPTSEKSSWKRRTTTAVRTSPASRMTRNPDVRCTASVAEYASLIAGAGFAAARCFERDGMPLGYGALAGAGGNDVPLCSQT